MWEYNYTDELYHYGVLGMRWGVRKAKRGERRAIRRAVKSTSDADRNSALAEAKKHRSDVDRIKSAHKNAKDNNKYMRLNKDGSISEVSQKQERMINTGRVVGKGALKTVGAVAIGVGTLMAAKYSLVYVGKEFVKALGGLD